MSESMSPEKLLNLVTAELPSENDILANFSLICALRNAGRAAASAWEADRKRLEEALRPRCDCGEHRNLEARIEALEKARLLAVSEWSTWKDVLVSNMTEADWRETMDGLRVPAAEEVPDDTHD